MSNTLKFGNGEWYGKEGAILAYNDENNNYKPLLFDFDRASSATRVNKDGLIETVSSNQPRVDYKDDSKGALLLEPSRSNLLTYSEDFSDASWTKFQTSISVNETISPDGTLNADKLISSNVDTNHPISSVLINGSSNNYSASCYFKKGEYNYGFIRLITDSAANRYGVLINLTNGVVENEYTTGSPSNTSYKVDKLKNGWYRLSLTSLNTSGTVQLSISASNVSNPYVAGNIPYFLGDGTSGIYIWGAQVEEGSYATSYIPTQGSASTRAQDGCSQTPPSGIIGQTEGTLFADIYLNLASSNIGFYTLQVYDSSFSPTYGKAVYLELYQGKVYGYVRNSTVQCEILSGIYADGQRLKMALAYKSNDFALYVNGVQIGIDTSGSLPSVLNAVSLHYSAGSQQASPLSQAQIYNTRLSNKELQALTS